MKNYTQFEKNHEFSRRIHELIPAGAHTYSKGDDQFPYLAPKGIVKGKGVRVWDVDGNEYIDWAMGLTAVSLGHAYEPVLEAVREELERGANFQRPSVIELEFAERLKKLLPHFDMFKFSKNGSTVTTAATKLARAYTGRDLVAVPAEHPFFSYDDWFIGATACDFGIPDPYKSLTLKFKYNDLESLENLFLTHPERIACIMMEPMKFEAPAEGYLLGVQGLCKKYGAVFIMDEMITGFRFHIQGAHQMFGVEPDLATYGKGVGNGFSVSFLAGKREIMELGAVIPGKKKVFLISTTHGAETHGLAAAIRTIDILESEKVIEKNWEKGRLVLAETNGIIREAGLENHLEMIGYPVWPALVCKDSAGSISMAYRTLFLQEMIRRGILFQGTFTFAHLHGQAEIDETLEAFRESCGVYKQAIEKGSVEGLLVGDPVKPVFREIN